MNGKTRIWLRRKRHRALRWEQELWDLQSFLHLAKGKPLSSCPVPRAGSRGSLRMETWGQDVSGNNRFEKVVSLMCWQQGAVGNAQLRPPAPAESCTFKKWNPKSSEGRMLWWEKRAWTSESYRFGWESQLLSYQLCDLGPLLSHL